MLATSAAAAGGSIKPSPSRSSPASHQDSAAISAGRHTHAEWVAEDKAVVVRKLATTSADYHSYKQLHLHEYDETRRRAIREAEKAENIMHLICWGPTK